MPLNRIVKPIEMDIKSAQSRNNNSFQPLKTFTSYSFERSIMVPASSFRFTAPGVDSKVRQSIRSGDMIELFAVQNDGTRVQIATGFIDETDTHITPSSVEYVLTGRDTLGQLVDNAAVDSKNKVIIIKNVSLPTILQFLIKNTQIPTTVITQQVPNAPLLFQTHPGESKLAAFQRYLEFSNCLIWSNPNGQVKLGRPNFTQRSSGSLVLSRTNPGINNLLEARVRRNVHTAIRQIVVQLQDLNNVDAGAYTKFNFDDDMKKIAPMLGGRSVYQTLSYGRGNEVINLITQVGNSDGSPFKIGEALALREIAKDNMKILEVEAVTSGHLNSQGNVYDVDQVYNVQLPDDNVLENMYVYSVGFELTLQHGMTTRLKLVRLGTIVLSDQLPRTA